MIDPPRYSYLILDTTRSENSSEIKSEFKKKRPSWVNFKGTAEQYESVFIESLPSLELIIYLMNINVNALAGTQPEKPTGKDCSLISIRMMPC